MVVEVDAWPPLSLRVNVVVADEPASLRRDTGATSTTVSQPSSRLLYRSNDNFCQPSSRLSNDNRDQPSATNHLRSNDNTSINLNITVTLDPERPCSLVSKFHRKGRS
ncbi:hypothetical protein CC2G_008277 [Coprinopsis cinerea AmutBmut pab1-1]|nr:hypothetical protein CC2G_008277 [Coprinopsis cinerea AmutBmut pab1-1]